MEQDGSARRVLGKAQGENRRLPKAFPTTDELGEPELRVLLLLVLPNFSCPKCAEDPQLELKEFQEKPP